MPWQTQDIFVVQDSSQGGSLDAFLALLQMTDSGGTGAPFVSRNKWSDELVFPDSSHRLLVSLVGPTRRIELWPVNLVYYVSTDWGKDEGQFTYRTP